MEDFKAKIYCFFHGHAWDMSEMRGYGHREQPINGAICLNGCGRRYS